MEKLRILVASIIATTTILSINSSAAKAEWKQDTNGYWYSQENSYATKWSLIDGVWYYFNSDGYMKTGWVLENNNWYFMDSSGAMQTGIIQVDGKKYYLAGSGDMKTGNVNIAGEIYTFAMSGEAIGDKIPQTDKAFSGDGAVVTPVQIKNTLKSNGKTVEISLEGNPTTGYGWNYHFNTEGIIKADSSTYKQYNTNVEMTGVGGTYTWIFSALKEGTVEITFEYLRPWEKEINKTKTYICTVDKDLKITIKEKE